MDKEVITKDAVRSIRETQADRLELYHYMLWKLTGGIKDDGYERIH